MDTKKVAIVCAIIVVVCVVVAAVAINLNQSEETQIKVLSNSSLYNGENVTVQLITENGTSIANQAVNITIVDANGGRNIQNLVTDSEGKASFTLGGVAVGNYTLECSFGGSEGYNPSNTTARLEIKEKIVQQVQKSKNYNYDSSIVDEEVRFNAQYGEGYFREVSYSDGNFRQYDVNTGKLIGSSYQSDQKYLEQRY